MAIMRYDKIVKYDIKAKCGGPLHVGSSVGGKEEVLIHPVSGQPFLQATGIAGAFRGYYAENAGESKVGYLFGDTAENKSRIVFSDGVFDPGTVKMERRSHVKIDRKTGSVTSEKGSGQKFELEYIGIGSVFTCSITVFVDSKDSDSYEVKAVEEMLFALKSGDILLGAKKSSGAGKVHPIFVSKNEYDMKTAEGRANWSAGKCVSNENYLDKLAAVKSDSIAYKITVCGATEGAMQIKGIAVNSFGAGAADSENFRNAEGDYIIPGSSLRGAIRSQMEKIASYLNKDCVIADAFGKIGNSQVDSKIGNLIFSDSVVGAQMENDSNDIRHRIHIDKFTGGVINKGLFAEKNIAGDFELSIDILNKNNADATLGLLILAIRDLAIKTFSLGNGYATGKGFVDVTEIKIQRQEEVATIRFGEYVKITNGELIDEAIKALQEVA